MKKNFVSTLLTAFVALSLIACGNTNQKETSSGNSISKSSKQEDVSQEKHQEISIVESGYSIKSDSIGGVYVYYGITLSNPNKKLALQFPVITVTGKSEDGSIIGTHDQTLYYIAPDDTVSFGGLMSCNGAVPATVDITATSGDFISGTNDDIVPSSAFTISNTNELIGTYGNVSYTGEIINNTDKAYTSVQVTVLLKNNGTIVYGDSTYVSDLPANGSKAFELSTYDVPEHTEYILSAQCW